MAVELQHIIHRVVRKRLFPQLVQEEAILAGTIPPTVEVPLSVTSSFSSSTSTTSFTNAWNNNNNNRSINTTNTTPSLIIHSLNNSSSNNLSNTSFLSLNNRPDAKERRRLVQRTRILKSDIQKFETEFKSLHGYEPKTMNDRNQMNNVYEELRKLKLIIRDNAALHIQSVYRGYLARKKFKQMKKSNITTNKPITTITNDNNKSTVSTSSTNTSLSEAMLKLSALRDEKATLKRQLRQFDVDFAAKHAGRVPTKAEKEHLRPAYTRYHALKNLITEAEIAAGVTSTKDRSDSPPPPPLPSTSATSAPSSSVSIKATSSAPNPTTATITAKPTLTTSSSNSSLSSVNSSTSNPNTDNTRLRSDSGTSGIGLDTDDDIDNLLNDHNHPTSATGDKSKGINQELLANTTPEQLTALRTEKKKLQAQLRDYEKEFLARNGRAVKYVKDIAPVMAKYTRYKALKAQLKELGVQ